MAATGTALGRFVKDNPAESAARLRAMLAEDPRNAEGWRLLGQALRLLGSDEEAADAEVSAVRATAFEPDMIAIARALNADDLPEAEALLRRRLAAQPFDIAGIRLMAELAARIGRLRDSETLLRRALELAPGFTAARANLATVLYKQNRFAEAVAELDRVLESGEANPSSRNLLAVALGRIGDYDEALRLYEELTPAFPQHAKLWMSYGHILKTVGRQDESVAAYRRALAAQPGLGEVWWSLANLKTVRFSEADIAAMEQALDGELAHEDRLHLHFALGKAWADAGEAEKSFDHYARGNALAPRRDRLRPRGADRAGRPHDRRAYARIPRRARSLGRSGARPDLHPRPAPRGLDAGRADPRLPQPGRRHDGAARRAVPRPP